MRDEGGNSYTVVIRRDTDRNQQTDGTADAVTAGADVKTDVLNVDASGKATFEITASDPDPTDSNNADGDGTDPDTNKIDRVRVSYTVTATTGGRAVADNATVEGSSGTGTITFSDARGVPTAGSLKPTVSYLAAPSNGSASNVVTVTVVDQFGKPVRGHLVQLSSNHSTNPPADADTSTFPVARRTDSSGTVRIGYSHSGTGSIEALVGNTSVTNADDTITLNAITGANASFYWVTRPTTAGDITAAILRVADVERNSVVIAADGGVPQLLVYDDNDQFVVDGSNATLAAFEEALARDDDDNNDTVGVTEYDPRDASTVARFTVTQN